jgi:hypothetical protein
VPQHARAVEHGWTLFDLLAHGMMVATCEKPPGCPDSAGGGPNRTGHKLAARTGKAAMRRIRAASRVSPTDRAVGFGVGPARAGRASQGRGRALAPARGAACGDALI